MPGIRSRSAFPPSIRVTFGFTSPPIPAGLAAQFSEIEVYGTSGGEAEPGAIPGKIEAENYSAMNGIQTEPTTDTGGGLNVGWIHVGDWLDYNVNVENA